MQASAQPQGGTTSSTSKTRGGAPPENLGTILRRPIAREPVHPDEIRREVCDEARRAGQTALASDLKGRFALWKNPANLTPRQQLKLAHI
jgi:hypothetical protein